MVAIDSSSLASLAVDDVAAADHRHAADAERRNLEALVRACDTSCAFLQKPVFLGDRRVVRIEAAAPCATVAVAATSMLTLPIVRTRSGSVSTAISKASGSIGTPMARQIGAIEVTKLAWPGMPTAPIVVVAAAATPIASCAGVSSMPNQ